MSQFEREFARIEYDEYSGAVIGQLQEFVEGEPFREYMNELIDVIEQNRARKVIGDTSQFEAALTQEDQAWAATDWAPRAQDAGVDHMAMVMPDDVVAKMSVDSIVEMTDDSINRELFSDIDEAKSWLREQ
jgi:hypothetical protein